MEKVRQVIQYRDYFERFLLAQPKKVTENSEKRN